MIKYFLLASLGFAVLNFGYAQKKKKKEVYEEIEVELDVESSSPQSFNNSRAREYEFSNLNEEYQWFTKRQYSSGSRKYGIMDRLGNVVLPPLFFKSYSSYSNDNVILQLGKNYGLFNLEEKQWIIPLEYQSLARLGYGSNYYKVKKDGDYGVIDNQNDVVIPFQWESIQSISGLNNYLIVSVNSNPSDLYGVFSITDNKLIVPCDYTSLYQVGSQNYFKVKNGSKYNIIDINNRAQLRTWYDDLVIPRSGRNNYIVKLNNKMGIIDSKESTVVPMDFLEISSSPYSDGSYLARDKHGKYGFMRIDGTVTLPFQYDNLDRKYNNNVISVQNGKCGIVQVNSGVPVEILACDYDNIKQDGGDYALIVEKDQRFGLLDKYGVKLTDVVYETLEFIQDNSGFVYKGSIGGKYNLIDQRGETITSEDYSKIEFIPQYDEQGGYYYRVKFNYFKVKSAKQFRILDKVGRPLVTDKFDDIKYEAKNYLVVKNKNKFGLFSIRDKKLSTGYEYDQIAYEDGVFYGFKAEVVESIIAKGSELNKEPVKY